MTTQVSTQLHNSRKELLDLGLRNPLINFKSRNKIEIVDEISENIYSILVQNSKVMRFLPLPTADLENDDELTKELMKESKDWTKWFAQSESEGLVNSNRHNDNYLQTNLAPIDLHKRLLALHSGARTYLEEQGVNILYLALGFLHWFDDGAKQTRKAPLVLIPIDLKRNDAKEKFSAVYNKAEIGANLSLIEKLFIDFNVRIPPISDQEDFSIIRYFEQVSASITNRAGWRVSQNEMVVSFFSFGKFVMYSDLDTKKWPDIKKPENHPILSILLHENIGFKGEIIDSDSSADEIVLSDGLIQVIDSDSSQTLAQADINRGNNLVIQGPPGTGKSQTITNIIADAVYKGKKVLFVAEKMAALEVVKRRLDAMNLGDAVLELHSHKANKKSLIAELERTLNIPKPQIKVDDYDYTALQYLRQRIEDLVKAMNTPILESGQTPVDLIGKIAELRRKGRNLKVFPEENLLHLSQESFKIKRMILDDAMGRMKSVGNPSKNVFNEITLKSITPLRLDSIKKNLEAAKGVIEAIQVEIKRLSEIGIENIIAVNDLQIFLEAGSYFMGKPDGAESCLLRTILTSPELIKRLLEQFEHRSSLEEKLKDKTDTRNFVPDIDKLVSLAKKYKNKWWSFVFAEKRHLTKRSNEIFPGERKWNDDDRLSAIEALSDLQRINQELERDASRLTRFLGSNWSEYKQYPGRLVAIINWVKHFQSSDHPALFVHFVRELILNDLDFKQMDSCSKILAVKKAEFERLTKELSESLDHSKISPSANQNEVMQSPFSELNSLISLWIDHFEDLNKIIVFNSLCSDLKNEDLSYLNSFLNDWEEAPVDLGISFEFSYYQALLDHVYSTNPTLSSFDKSSHEKMLDTFRELDKKILINNRSKVRLNHWNSIPHLNSEYGQIGVLKHELNKKRRLLPIRQLLSEAGDAIKKIKPVFMMGPMSVASFLPPGMEEFDLVIFDEASQVKPVDAYGAILRGKQVVVIGDSKQLPPTSFFESVSSEIAGEDDNIPVSSETESILGLFQAKNAPERMLNWHYRSKHESLIAVSNKEFYNDRLIVFPSPGSENSDYGLSFVHLPEAMYGRGSSRSNIDEAYAVAYAVMEHIQKRPQLSLGVAAFSSAQRDAIMYQLEALRNTNSHLEFFFQNHQSEPFFIKNLENVQGDERDVILISVGYGRSKPGEPINMNFGPLNKDGGERRLNVLISRAKKICKVFANFTYRDMDLSRSNSTGVSALRSFLQYAETGVLEQKYSDSWELAPFVNHLHNRLAEAGFSAEPQVGISDYKIDIAIRNADQKESFTLGIECDGPNYASAHSTRDRARLRKEVLEGLGWQLHRIWALDWYRNEDAEFNNLVSHISNCEKSQLESRLNMQTISDSMQETDQLSQFKEQSENSIEISDGRKSISVENYQIFEKNIEIGNSELHNVNPYLLIKSIQEVVDFEGPIHVELLMKRITNGVGLQKTGNRIHQNIMTSINMAVHNNLISVEDNFLFKKEEPIVIRDRSLLDPQMKRFDLIPPMELENAMIQFIKHSFSVEDDDLINASFHLLGFQKVTSQMKELGQKLIDKALSNGSIYRDSFKRLMVKE